MWIVCFALTVWIEKCSADATTELPLEASDSGIGKKATIILSVLLGVPAIVLLYVLFKSFNPFGRLSAKWEEAEKEKHRQENERIRALVKKTYRKHSLESTPVVVIKSSDPRIDDPAVEIDLPMFNSEPYHPPAHFNEVSPEDYQGMCAAGECCEFDHLWAEYYAKNPDEYFDYYAYYFMTDGMLSVDEDGFFVENAVIEPDMENYYAKMEVADEMNDKNARDEDATEPRRRSVRSMTAATPKQEKGPSPIKAKTPNVTDEDIEAHENKENEKKGAVNESSA